MSFSGNNIILTLNETDYSEDPYSFRETYGSVINDYMRKEFQGDANNIRKVLQDGSGVTGMGVIVVWKLNNVEIGRRTF